MRTTDPIHPGVTLLEDFMEPHGLSANRLATRLGVPQNRISDIVRGRRGISADTALRLEKAFGVSAQFWLNLQQQYDLIQAYMTAGDQIEKIERLGEAA
ncbi:HigA family addiction module antitoxin [Azospirillum sp. ST 5-10]|uniref:HigA family addiction module antitoxin n=1 Tax=unclassified Azospirillum TaxID=2630922 RepID=UPI003F4A0EA9